MKTNIFNLTIFVSTSKLLAKIFKNKVDKKTKTFLKPPKFSPHFHRCTMRVLSILLPLTLCYLFAVAAAKDGNSDKDKDTTAETTVGSSASAGITKEMTTESEW